MYPSLPDILLGFGAPYITIFFMFLIACVFLWTAPFARSLRLVFLVLRVRLTNCGVMSLHVMSLLVVLCNGVSGQCKSMFMCMFMFMVMVIGWVRWGG